MCVWRREYVAQRFSFPSQRVSRVAFALSLGAREEGTSGEEGGKNRSPRGGADHRFSAGKTRAEHRVVVAAAAAAVRVALSSGRWRTFPSRRETRRRLAVAADGPLSTYLKLTVITCTYPRVID